MREIEGRTADGIDIEAKVDMAGNLVEVEADNGALPQPLIDALVPAELRGQQVMGLFGSITEVKQRPDHVEIKGRQPSASEIEAKFDRQNTLIGVEVDDAAIPSELVDTLLPQAVRNNEVIAQFGRIDEIGNRSGRVWSRAKTPMARICAPNSTPTVACCGSAARMGRAVIAATSAAAIAVPATASAACARLVTPCMAMGRMERAPWAAMPVSRLPFPQTLTPWRSISG